MSRITELHEKLNAIGADLLGIKAEIQKEYNKVFKASPVVKAMLTKLDGTPDGYDWNEHGDEIVSWFRVEGLDEFSESPAKEYFESYLADAACCYDVDFENDVLKVGVGGAFVINDDGDVYERSTSAGVTPCW